MQAPPTDAMSFFVTWGKLTIEPLTFVSVTAGDVLSTVTVLFPEPPVLPAASVWLAANV